LVDIYLIKSAVRWCKCPTSPEYCLYIPWET